MNDGMEQAYKWSDNSEAHIMEQEQEVFFGTSSIFFSGMAATSIELKFPKEVKWALLLSTMKFVVESKMMMLHKKFIIKNNTSHNVIDIWWRETEIVNWQVNQI